MKRLIIALVLIVSAAGGGFYYYKQQPPQNDPSTIQLYGNVDIRDVVLGFRISGRINALAFEEGDEVKKGEVLAILDKELLNEDLALRKAELDEAQAVLSNAEKLFKRRQNLVNTGAISQGAFDDALAARDEARARVATAQARLDQAKTGLADSEIIAPDSGIILTRVREPGSIVAAGAPVYTLALNNPVWVRTYIDEPNLGHIFPGQKATVSTDSGHRYQGQIGFISPQAEFTPKNVETTQLRTDLVYRLRVIIDAPDQGLRQGMPVTVEIAKPKQVNKS